MMEPLNTQVSSLYGVNMGEYGEAGVSSMMALMTAHELHGDGESIIRRRVPLHSLFNGHAAQSLASASAVLAPLPMFEPNKLQRQSQAVMEQQFSTKVPLVKIEGGCNNLPNRFGLHREQAVNCFAESSSMQLVNQAVDSLGSQAPEAHSPHFSSNSRTPITTASDEDEADAMKAKILAHPGYLCLLEAYINCQKVGAPPEVVARLDAAGKEHEYRLNQRTTSIGKDPELDRFMEAYREMLNTYQEELMKPLNEALSFFKKIETQFNSLTNGSISISPSGTRFNVGKFK